MSYRSMRNYYTVHVFPTCARRHRDGVLSHTGNNVLHACVLQNPLRQEQNADSITAAVPPLPSALIKPETSSAPDHQGASGMPCAACGQVQTTSGRFLRTANRANQQSVTDIAWGNSISGVYRRKTQLQHTQVFTLLNPLVRFFIRVSSSARNKLGKKNGCRLLFLNSIRISNINLIFGLKIEFTSDSFWSYSFFLCWDH